MEKKDSTFVSQKYIHNIFSLQNNNKQHVKYKFFPKDFDISEEKKYLLHISTNFNKHNALYM